MNAPPLSHHEILGLVEPFRRRGRQVDLAASDRAARRLVFKPAPADGAAGAGAVLPETWQLENPSSGTWRLVRTLHLPGGQAAALHTDGPDPGVLLARLEAVPQQQQWCQGPGYQIALAQRLSVPAAGGPPQLLLQRGVAQLDCGLLLKLRVPSARGTAADINLLVHGAPAGTPAGTAARRPALPEDLLAVLGWHWTRIRQDGASWSSKLRLRGHEPQRSRLAEAQLQRAARHLATTLSEPPQRYHAQWYGARWGAYFRRAIPLLTFLGLGAAAVAMPALGFDQHSVARIMIFDGPLILLGLSLCLQEMSRFEIPPWPRRPAADAWGGAGAAPPGG